MNRLLLAPANPKLTDVAWGRKRHRGSRTIRLHARSRLPHDGLVVLDEFSELSLLLLADRGLQGQGVPGHRKDFFDLLRGQADALADLFRRGLPAERLHELWLSPAHLVDEPGHVRRD